MLSLVLAFKQYTVCKGFSASCVRRFKFMIIGQFIVIHLATLSITVHLSISASLV